MNMYTENEKLARAKSGLENATYFKVNDKASTDLEKMEAVHKYNQKVDEYVEKVLPELITYEHPVNMPEWFVPETYYYLWDDGHLVGEFRIRHHLTQALRTGAGHIGYSILKGVRGKGYGTEGLRLTVMIAKDIIPEDEIYLRVNKDNIASQKVMIKNGAQIAGEDETHLFMRIAK